MKEAFELIRKRMEKTTEFLSDCTKYGNKDAVQQRKSYDTMYMYEIALLVEELIDIVSEVEAEYINKSTEHINKSSDCSTNWIPCSERLPENDDDVLVWYRHRMMRGVNIVGSKEMHGIGHYYKPTGSWLINDGLGLDQNVVAWMLLPSPYTPTTD